MKHKRFLLFAGSNYYPSGGMHDFIDSFDTLEEAKEYVIKAKMYDWWHALDTETFSREGDGY